ncbi:MAG: helix-turn-helix domain-containing protein [Psychrilyobacter sp.]|uniref:helix-turn-helix domain-containing protein n=1 Tax=Psychrilyobacter sp. TaxID=2586924 RepID=UPI003C771B15
MSINKVEISLIKMIVENRSLNLNDAEKKFLKSPIALKRNIQNINQFLPEDGKVQIKKGKIVSKLSYINLLNFIKEININNYSSNSSERINLLMVFCLIKNPLNKTKLYNELGISLSTLKNDTKQLKKTLLLFDLKLEISPKKGVFISGKEEQYRILVTSILFNIIDIDSNRFLKVRNAITPLDNYIANEFINNFKNEVNESIKELNYFFKKNNLKITNRSRKYICIYFSIAKKRIKEKKFIKTNFNPPLFIPKSALVSKEKENLILNIIMESLDYPLFYINNCDKKLKNQIENLITLIDEEITISKFEEEDFFKEVYNYIYKCILRRHYGLDFFDHKISGLSEKDSPLFSLLNSKITSIENFYNIKFTKNQKITLTLILKKYIMRNNIVERNQKKIILVTTYASEVVNYFIEQSKRYIDIDIIAIISTDELESLIYLNYDSIFVFSSRVKFILSEHGIDSFKINFHLSKDDIKMLLGNGFSESKSRIKADLLIEEIRGLSDEKLKLLLKKKFSNFFL